MVQTGRIHTDALADPPFGKQTQTEMTVLKFCVVLDVTASQQCNIDNIKTHLKSIVNQIMSTTKVVVQIALVLYRDHPQNGDDSGFVVRIQNFTNQVQDVLESIRAITASGGGDMCEAVAHTMKSVLTELDWGIPPDEYDEPVNMVVWITDAPPHGIGGEDDRFPNGCPGHDGVELMDEFAKKNICVSVAACGGLGDPRITSPYCPGNAFFRLFTRKTGGTFVNLSQAQQLVAVITNTAVETVELNALASQVDDMAVGSAAQGPDDAVFRSLSAKSATLTECDEELCKIDTNGSDLEARACLSPVNDVKNDKEFKDAFAKWLNTAMQAQRAKSTVHTRDVRDIRRRLDCGEGEAVYRSLGAKSESTDEAAYRSCGSSLDDCAPIPMSFSSSPPETPIRMPKDVTPRREQTADRLKVLYERRALRTAVSA